MKCLHIVLRQHSHYYYALLILRECSNFSVHSQNMILIGESETESKFQTPFFMQEEEATLSTSLTQGGAESKSPLS